MPIDPSIALQARGLQLATPFEQAAQLAQIQQARNANASQAQNMQLGQLKLDEYGQQKARGNRLAQLVQGMPGTATDEERINALKSGGFFTEADVLQTGNLNRRKIESEAATKEEDTKKSKYDLSVKKNEQAIKDIIGFSSPQQALESLARHEAAGDITPDRAAMVRQTIPQNPAQFGGWQLSMVKNIMSAKDRMGYEAPDANAKLQSDTTRRGQNLTESTAARGQDITMRGQDLTNERMRDTNAIKSNEKKATEELTKGGQIASFDTMLGTLDRLSSHPGLSKTVGLRSVFPTVPGSDSANFQSELNTFQSQAFIPMVAQLKGMGALSDAEGRKLTQAVGALEPKMGEQAFRDSIQRITKDMESAYSRVAGKQRAGTVNSSVSIDALLNKYK